MSNYISVKDVYRAVLSEWYCATHRRDCSKDCSRCNAYVSPEEADSAYVYIVSLLKARDPALYLLDDLTELQNILKGFDDVSNH